MLAVYVEGDRACVAGFHGTIRTRLLAPLRGQRATEYDAVLAGHLSECRNIRDDQDVYAELAEAGEARGVRTFVVKNSEAVLVVDALHLESTRRHSV